MEILHKKANEPPRPMLELRADVPPQWWPWWSDHGAQPERPATEHGRVGAPDRDVEMALSVTPPRSCWPSPLKCPRAGRDRRVGTLVVPPNRLRILARSWYWMVLGRGGHRALSVVWLSKGHPREPVVAASVDAMATDTEPGG